MPSLYSCCVLWIRVRIIAPVHTTYGYLIHCSILLHRGLAYIVLVTRMEEQIAPHVEV
jgi:hypothetical protein